MSCMAQRSSPQLRVVRSFTRTRQGKTHGVAIPHESWETLEETLSFADLKPGLQHEPNKIGGTSRIFTQQNSAFEEWLCPIQDGDSEPGFLVRCEDP